MTIINILGAWCAISKPAVYCCGVHLRALAIQLYTAILNMVEIVYAVEWKTEWNGKCT